MKTLVTIVLALATCFTVSAASFTEQQKTDIQQIVHDYLLEKPEILIEVSEKLQQKEQAAEMEAVKQAIIQNKATLFDNQSPSAGNPKAKALVVEFFDYRCIHCKNMAPVLTALYKKDQNVKVLYKELPIFGGVSVFAAKAALAANLQQKYAVFHDALMATTTELTNEQVLTIAKQTGLNMEKLQQDMNSAAIDTAIKNNTDLAQTLGISATPAFIFTTNPPAPEKAGKLAFRLGEIPAVQLQQMAAQMQQ